MYQVANNAMQVIREFPTLSQAKAWAAEITDEYQTILWVCNPQGMIVASYPSKRS